MCWRHFFKKVAILKILLKKTSTQVFFCEICKMFKDANFDRIAPVAASDF